MAFSTDAARPRSGHPASGGAAYRPSRKRRLIERCFKAAGGGHRLLRRAAENGEAETLCELGITLSRLGREDEAAT